MRKISVSVLLSLLLLLIYSGAANASKDKVNVTVQFKCNFLSKYMEKHGYVFIESSNKMNIFAAMNAKITIKDMNDKIVGSGIANKNGEFTSYVPAQDNYKVIVEFHGHESEFEMASSKADNFTAYLGYFESDEIGGWVDAKLALR